MKTFKHATREEWLRAAVSRLRKKFSDAGVILPAPEALAITCGWPSRGGTSAKKRVIGECWPPDASVGSVTEIFVSPWQADPINDDGSGVLETIMHELIHAAGVHGHGAEFKDAMKKLGLTGRATSTRCGDELRDELRVLAGELGDYPHWKLDEGRQAIDAPKKQKGRMIKVYCVGEGAKEKHEEYVLRASKKTLSLGVPCCPVCDCDMIVEMPEENEDDD